MSFLDKISNFYYKNRKNILYVLMFLFIFTVFTDLSFASGNGGNGTTTVSSAGVEQAGKTESNIFFDALNQLNKIISALLGMLTFLVGLFLYPAWTNGSFIGLVEPLKTMWIMVSNIVYFIFAFIFIFIAFMNIIGKEDSYQLKQALPKFIVGVLIVPFSWFFVQFVISLSGILTVGVLSLPYDTFKGTDFFSEANLRKIEICSNFTITKDKTSCENATKTLYDVLDGKNSESLFGIMSFYTYAVMGVENGGKLFQGEVKTFNGLVDLGVKAVVDIIFVIIYLLLMIALFLALFVRGVMLWGYAMFSPVFGLLYFFGKGGEGAGSGSTKHFNIKEFVKLAMVPVLVAGALAFGLVFIFIAGHGLTIDGKNQITNIIKIEENGNKLTFGEFGSITWSGSKSDSAIRGVSKLVAGFQGSIGTTLLQIFGLGILWMAVMAALKSSAITESVVQPISSFGDKVGELIKAAPTYAPIIPAPGGGMMTSSGLQQVGTSIKTHYDQKSLDSSKQFLSRTPFGGDAGSNKAREVLTELNNLSGVNELKSEHLRKYTDALKELGNVSNISTSQPGKDMIKKLGVLLGINDIKVDSQANIAKAIGDIHDKLITDNNALYGNAGYGLKNGRLNQDEKSLDGINNLLTGGRGDGGQNSSQTHMTDIDSQASTIRGNNGANKVGNTNVHMTFNRGNLQVSTDDHSARQVTLSSSNVNEVSVNSSDITKLKEIIGYSNLTNDQIKEFIKKMFNLNDNDPKINEIYGKLTS